MFYSNAPIVIGKSIIGDLMSRDNEANDPENYFPFSGCRAIFESQFKGAAKAKFDIASFLAQETNDDFSVIKATKGACSKLEEVSDSTVQQYFTRYCIGYKLHRGHYRGYDVAKYAPVGEDNETGELVPLSSLEVKVTSFDDEETDNAHDLYSKIVFYVRYLRGWSEKFGFDIIGFIVTYVRQVQAYGRDSVTKRTIFQNGCDQGIIVRWKGDTPTFWDGASMGKNHNFQQLADLFMGVPTSVGMRSLKVAIDKFIELCQEADIDLAASDPTQIIPSKLEALDSEWVPSNEELVALYAEFLTTDAEQRGQSLLPQSNLPALFEYVESWEQYRADGDLEGLLYLWLRQNNPQCDAAEAVDAVLFENQYNTRGPFIEVAGKLLYISLYDEEVMREMPYIITVKGNAVYGTLVGETSEITLHAKSGLSITGGFRE